MHLLFVSSGHGKGYTTNTYAIGLERRLAALTAERDSLRSTAERLSSERDNLQCVVEKMQDELRQLRRMLFDRKSECFIPSDPSQLKLDFEGVAELKEEREYSVLQGKAARRHASSDRPKTVSGVSFRSIWNAVTRSSNPRTPSGKQTHRQGDHRTAGIQARGALYPPSDTPQICLAEW